MLFSSLRIRLSVSVSEEIGLTWQHNFRSSCIWTEQVSDSCNTVTHVLDLVAKEEVNKGQEIMWFLIKFLTWRSRRVRAPSRPFPSLHLNGASIYHTVLLKQEIGNVFVFKSKNVACIQDSWQNLGRFMTPRSRFLPELTVSWSGSHCLPFPVTWCNLPVRDIMRVQLVFFEIRWPGSTSSHPNMIDDPRVSMVLVEHMTFFRILANFNSRARPEKHMHARINCCIVKCVH